MRNVLMLSCAAIMFAFVACEKGTDPTDQGNDPNAIASLNLKVGMFWNATTWDTTRTAIDSATNQTTSTTRTLHRSYNEVTGVNQGANDEVNYTIKVSDTLIDPQTDEAISHSDSTMVWTEKDDKLQYEMSIDTLGFSESAAVTMLDFPVTTGKSWDVADLDIDSSFRFQYGNFGLKMRAVVKVGGTSKASAVATYQFGDANRVYYPVSTTMNASIAAIIDTTISLLGTNIVTKGDSALTTKLKVTSLNYLSTDFTIPLRTQQTSISYIRNGFSQVVQRDTVKSVTVVTRLRDPKTNEVISQ